MKVVRPTIRLLAISGSLRAASNNTALLRAAITLAPECIEIVLYDGVGDLPHFNPDIEDVLPASVLELRAKVKASDGLLIACPEYAHGVPGAFKNALDWLVGDEEFVNKPVALLNAAPRATHAQASLAETIRTMSGRIVTEASVVIPLPGKHVDAEDIVSNRELANTLRAATITFASTIEKYLAEEDR